VKLARDTNAVLSRWPLHPDVNLCCWTQVKLQDFTRHRGHLYLNAETWHTSQSLLEQTHPTTLHTLQEFLLLVHPTTLHTSSVSFHLDYCNSLLSSVSDILFKSYSQSRTQPNVALPELDDGHLLKLTHHGHTFIFSI